MSASSLQNGSKEILSTPLRKTHMVGPYMIGDTIGEGSYAKVKDGINIETLIRVAVKVFSAKKIKKIPNGQISVDNEINILKKLKHKNILNFYASLYNEDSSKICLIYELCATSVQKMLDSAFGNKLPKFQAHDYFKQTLSALFYLESRLIVHLDIKPGNLLIKFDNVIKIGDFGAAQEVEFLDDGSYRSIKSGGSPAFQSPEVLSDEEIEDPFKIDVWSLGVTLYSMVMGRHPFMGENIYVICNNIAYNPSQVDLVGEDEHFQNVIKMMLERDPKKRATLNEIDQSKWIRTKPPGFESEVLFPPHSPHNPYFDTTTVERLEEIYIQHNDPDESSVRKAKRTSKLACLPQ